MINHPAIEYLRELNVLSLLVRYILAMVCGGLIGLERERKHRPAGFRTHILVCVGAATACMLGQYFVLRGYVTDIARLGAQVISGIGFLGAGTIIVTKHQQIKGLTTAAGLWASACVGLAIGAGFYEAALIGTALIVIAAAMLLRINKMVMRDSKYLLLYIEFTSVQYISSFLEYVRKSDMYVSTIDIDKNTEDNTSVLVAELECKQKSEHTIVLEQIKQLEGVKNIEVL